MEVSAEASAEKKKSSDKLARFSREKRADIEVVCTSVSTAGFSDGFRRLDTDSCATSTVLFSGGDGIVPGISRKFQMFTLDFWFLRMCRPA